ncbi:MAG TPA: hypothetical protein ENJ95_07960 [Bacteroidetes bacterium]|nr:hypothetical protein [Bacteroidota bacterium]
MKKSLLFLMLVSSMFALDVNAQCPPPGFPPTGDICLAAPALCSDINGYCATLGSNSSNQTFPGCSGNALNNDEWFSFIAGTTNLSLTIIPSNCQGTNGQFGMQGAIYEGGCNGPAIAAQCGCTTAAFTLTATLTVGLTYYVVFDGCAGDICDFEVVVNSGTTEPMPPPDPDPTGETDVCPGSIVDYSISVPGSGEGYTWTLTPPSLGTMLGPNFGSTVSIQWATPGMGQLCVEGINACGLSSNEVCIDINSQNLDPVDEFVDGCPFESVICAGQSFFIPGPGTIMIPVVQVNPIGCTFITNCFITGNETPFTDIGQQEICGNGGTNEYQVCDVFLSQSGIHNVVCEGASYLGCDSTVMVDLAIFDPEAIIAQPVGSLECGSTNNVTLDATGTLFDIVPDMVVEFAWTGPGIVGPDDDVTVEVDEPGEYCFTVTLSRNGTSCSDMTCVTVTQDSEEPMAPNLSGDVNPCGGASITYTVSPNGTPLPDDYTWTTPNGEPFTTISPTSIEVDWTGSVGGQLCVTANNTCGSSTPTCNTITVQALPVQAIITGEASPCATNQTQVYTITNSQANTTYTWTVPTGASFTGSGTSITVDFDGATTGAGQVCATATNPCGTSQPGCLNVTIGDTPPTAVMNGPASVCSNGTGYNYTVTNAQPGDTFNWTAPPGATINGNGATVGIDFNGASTGQVCVSLSNSCGAGMQACENVTVIQVPTATISGSGAFCEGETGDVDLTITLTGTGPWNVVYTLDNMNPTPLTINTSPHTLNVSQAGTYALTSLSGTGGCDGTVSGTAVVTENPAPTAVLSGADSVCEGSTDMGQLNIDLTGTAPWTVVWAVDNMPQAPIVVNASPFTLNVGAAQAGTITLTSVADNNNCTGTTSGTGTIALNTAPSVTSVNVMCNGANTTYTVTIVLSGGDPTTYSIEPENGTLAGNTFTSNPIFSGLGYSFTVSDANDCDPVLVASNIFECNCESMAGTMGLTPLEACGNGPLTAVYDNTNEFLDADDALSYVLHNGNGTSIVAPVLGQFATPEVMFDAATMTYGQTYYISAVVGNAQGTGVDLADPCLNVSLGTPITFNEIPTAALSGNEAICEGETAGLTVNFTGQGPWSVTYESGGNSETVNGITDNPYTLMVTPAGTGAVSYCLTDMSDTNCPGTAMGCTDVTVNTGVQVTDVGTACNATATAYTISFTISGGDPSSYFVTGVNGTISGNVFTSVEIPAGAGYMLTVDDANNCDPQELSQTQVPCDCQTDAGTMDMVLVEICGNGPAVVAAAANADLDADDILLYYLHEGASNSLSNTIASDTDPSFSFDGTNMSYGQTYYISAVVGNMDGNGGIDLNDPCLSVAPGTPVVFYEIPTASISGDTEICPGEMADLSIDLTGDSPWTVTINGDVIADIQGTPYIHSVQPAMTTTYVLTAVTDQHCDNTINGEEAVVTVHVPPTVSNVTAICNATSTAYTVSFDINDGDPTCYVVDLIPGTFTGNHFESAEIPSDQPYTIEVTDCHGCLPVVVADDPPTCGCLTSAGDIDGLPIIACQGDTVRAIHDTANLFLDPDDVLNFILSDLSGNLIAINTAAPEFEFNAALMTPGETYLICPVAGNDNGAGNVDITDDCIDLGNCVEVVFNEIPTATIAGQADICENTTGQLSIEFTGQGPWNFVYEDATGNQLSGTASDASFTLDVNPAMATAYSLVSVEDANGCPGTVGGVGIVSITLPPETLNVQEICDPTGDNYTVVFDIVGGDAATYTVSGGGTLAGATFTSGPMPSGSSYSFMVDDANGCGPIDVAGDHTCSCNTNVGTMSLAALTICGDETTLMATYNDAGEFLDPNDVFLFVLHDLNGNVVGNVFNSDPNSPEFAFLPGLMEYGQTYYISAVVGDNDGLGGIDFSDDCLAVAPGTPVVFYETPTISVSGPSAVCEGSPAMVTFTATGTPPLAVDFMQNGIPVPTVMLPATGTAEIEIPVPATTTITLVSIEDANGCINLSSESITIEVNPVPDAGTSLGGLTFCEGDNESVQLFDQLSGAGAGGVWTDPSGQVVPNGNLNIAFLPSGSNEFTYTVSGVPPCEDDQAMVAIEIGENPVADAGPDRALNCDISEVALGGGNTTPGIQYNWSGPGIQDATLMTQEGITLAGTYTLVVSNDQGCSDTDEVEVEENITMPMAFVTPNDVSCFGESDGFVVIDSVANGVAPYLFSLDGGPFLAQQAFLGLSPGDYSIIVEDNEGCSTSVSFTISEPEEVSVEIQPVFAGNDPFVQFGESLDLILKPTPLFEDLDEVVWGPPGVDSLCVGCSVITVTPTQQTSYSATITKDNCSAQTILTIFVSKERQVYVPNAFAPDGSGMNKMFYIFGGKSVVKIKSFLIFNRWGEIVHRSINHPPNDPSFGWDGTYRGEPLNPGVFVWFAEIEFIDGSTEMVEGDVILVR